MSYCLGEKHCFGGGKRTTLKIGGKRRKGCKSMRKRKGTKKCKGTKKRRKPYSRKR